MFSLFIKNLINFAGALTDYARGLKQSQTEEEENECLQFKKHPNCRHASGKVFGTLSVHTLPSPKC